MNAAGYRRVRISIGALTLGFCALVFADVGNWVPPAVARVGLWPQVIPSLLSWSQGAGWLAAGGLAVLVLTVVFGRVYCAMLCPLGVLMDVSAWLARRTGRKRRLPYRPGRVWPRVLAVAVCAAGLMAGIALPLALLDPYSVFGKITAATLRPALGGLNHLAASTGWFQPVDFSPVAWTTLGVALGLLGLVVVTAVFRGRLWCNTVCPVGAVLGLLSKRPLFGLRIAKSDCIACSMCERVCPAQCIDFRNHRIDHSRCVMCFDCVTSCRRSGIHMRFLPGRRQSPPVAEPPAVATGRSVLPAVGRRLFLASAVTLPAVTLAEQKGKGVQQRKRAGHGEDDGGGKGEKGGHGQGEGHCGECRCHGPDALSQHNKPAVLPPGARSLAHFQSHCTACHLCVANCPDQVLRPAITQHGLAGFLQPFQDFDISFCSYNCSNCSEVCPTGAIQPISIEERRLVRTGVAEFFRGRCVVKTEGTSCGACSEHCPTQAVHMVAWKNGLTIPEVEPELCIGCGGCEFICPVRPLKAIIVSGLAVHERAKPIEAGRANTVREMEEEFPF